MSIANVAREVIGDVRKSLILREPKGASMVSVAAKVAGIHRHLSHPVNPSPSQAFIQGMRWIVDA